MTTQTATLKRALCAGKRSAEDDARTAGQEAIAIRLDRDAVLPLEGKGRQRGIEVRRGTLWLTASPAEGDVLLQPGERFHFGGRGLFVIQALEDAEFVLIS